MNKINKKTLVAIIMSAGISALPVLANDVSLQDSNSSKESVKESMQSNKDDLNKNPNIKYKGEVKKEIKKDAKNIKKALKDLKKSKKKNIKDSKLTKAEINAIKEKISIINEARKELNEKYFEELKLIKNDKTLTMEQKIEKRKILDSETIAKREALNEQLKAIGALN